MARYGARHTSARPIVGIGPKSGLPLPPWLPHPSSRTPDAQYCRRPRPVAQISRLPAAAERRPRSPPLRPRSPAPRRAWAPRCLPGSLLQAAVACRRPRPPAFIPGSAPRRLPVSAPCLGASPPPRLPAAAQAQPAAPSPAPRNAVAASGTPSPHPSAPYPLPPSLGHSQISITELLTHCSRN